MYINSGLNIPTITYHVTKLKFKFDKRYALSLSSFPGCKDVNIAPQYHVLAQ